jgi:hypothetical protein
VGVRARGSDRPRRIAVLALAAAGLFAVRDNVVRWASVDSGPLNATQSLWGVLLAAVFLGRAEAVGIRLVAAAVLVVTGGVLIGATR